MMQYSHTTMKGRRVYTIDETVPNSIKIAVEFKEMYGAKTIGLFRNLIVVML